MKWGYFFGIDPGTQVVGYAHLAYNGRDFKALSLGTIPYRTGTRVEKYQTLYLDIEKMATSARAQVYAIESGFVGINMKTSLRIAESRGIIMAAMGACAKDVIEVSPSEVKKAVTGKGDATKDDVRYAVKCLLRLKIAPLEDAADAAGVAVAAALFA